MFVHWARTGEVNEVTCCFLQRCGEGTQDLVSVLLHQKCHLWGLTVCPLHPSCDLRYENMPSGQRHTLEQEETRRQFLHGNHSQFPTMWLDGVGTYLGQKEPERFAVCLQAYDLTFSGWFVLGNVPSQGHRLIWSKTIAREASSQAGLYSHTSLCLCSLSAVFSALMGMQRMAGETQSMQNDHKKKPARGLRSLFTELQFGARNSPVETDVSTTLRGSEIRSSCH